MRIVGGILKGRTLAEFKGKDIRPTSDNARESLFNILGEIKGRTFLDLFCGTGAVGIEAYSRGAIPFFCDFSEQSAKVFGENSEKLGVKSGLIFSDAIKFLKKDGKEYDIIFLDPPYNSPVREEALSLCQARLKDGGTVVYENDEPFRGVAQGLVLYDVRRYGKAFFSFFKKKNSACAVYAGSFDPVTVGHYRSVISAREEFGKVFVVLGENGAKETFFTERERLDLLKAAFNSEKGVEVISFSDFSSVNEYRDFLLKRNALYYVRGVRDEKDLIYEKKAEKRNAELYPEITTVYIICEKEYAGLSSTKVKKVIKNGGDFMKYIPLAAQEKFYDIISLKRQKQ